MEQRDVQTDCFCSSCCCRWRCSFCHMRIVKRSALFGMSFRCWSFRLVIGDVPFPLSSHPLMSFPCGDRSSPPASHPSYNHELDWIIRSITGFFFSVFFKMVSTTNHIFFITTIYVSYYKLFWFFFFLQNQTSWSWTKFITIFSNKSPQRNYENIFDVRCNGTN